MDWFWVLLILVGPVHSSGSVSWDEDKRQALFSDDTMRPLIYYCRSRNMEDFSCYWHPLENLTEREGVRYVLSYTKDKGPVLECPDYVSSGPHSCHFNSSHTNIWKIYCMNVTAVTPIGNYTSPQHCLDVAEIVETEAPVNLTHELHPSGGYESGHNCLISWTYPQPIDLQFGWITLVYELRYRRADEQDNWKEKTSLYEPQVELLGLPAEDFVVQVRCRSHNYGRWSQWSLPMYMRIPGRPPTGKLLLLLLVTGVSMVVLVGFSLGLVQQSKRIKNYFLPPIPKPRILGIDPLLLKKGNLEEINRHFSTFHGYSPPSYTFTDDVWDQVSADETFPLSAPALAPEHLHTITEKPSKPGNNPDPHVNKKEALIIPCNVANAIANANHGRYVSGPFASPASDLVLPVPGSEYSVMGQTGVTELLQSSQMKAIPDFYTCVQMLQNSGEVHLVPCLAPAYCSAFSTWDEKAKQKEEFEGRKNQDGGEGKKQEVKQEVKEEVKQEVRPVSVVV
ncbi:unnamed protein product [Knipowitschia caucasica]|uniref:Fibronectin type-III domain-containing protein n=1 Tax=Knipowitschia caucasica TaxID=637954 RepID=A0AAV2LAC0_KNICA